MTSIILEKTVLAGTNKAGILKADADGYYHVMLGAFGMENSQGIVYPFNDYLQAMFSPNSLLMKRMQNGRVRSEVEHPPIEPGMTLTAYLNRLRFINSKLTNSHIKAVKLTEAVDEFNHKILKCEGWVKPSGIYGPALEAQLKNKEENVCYSIRSIVAPSIGEDGRPCNQVREFITWDSVNDPGISVANKFESPGLESLTPNVLLTPELLHKADTMAKATNIGLESGGLFETTHIRDAAGWSNVQLIKPSVSSW
mgnify:CR=1 FL=1